MVDNAGERTIVNLSRAKESEPPTRLLDEPADCIYVRSRALDLAPLLSAKRHESLVVAQMPPSQPGCRPAQVLVASERDLAASDLERPWDAGRRVAGEGLEWLVLTRGSAGVEAFGSAETLRVPAPEVEAVDTTGSGDAFAAGLIHALLQGASMPSALATGAAWGAQSAASDSSVLPPEAVARLVGDS
jgi:sugar/nucleoside kinase (ribokinase family)